MATQASKFRVGLFLIVGFMLLSGTLIWLGASRVLEKSRTYMTYFQESVQGLDVGSPVKYRGVPLGRVSAIRVAPDGKLVEVEMDIKPGFIVMPEMRARLASAGITGAAFVEIGFSPTGVAVPPPPELSFPTPPNYIPSQPSFLTNLISALADIATNLQATDLPSVAAEYRALGAELRRFLAGPEVRNALARVEGAAESIAAASQRVEELVQDPRISKTLDRVSSTIARLDETAGNLRSLSSDPNLKPAIEEARTAAANFRQVSEELLRQTREFRLPERMDDIEGRVGAAADQIATTFQGAGRQTGAVLEGAAGAVGRADRLLRDLQGSLHESLGRLDRAMARVEELARSLAENPSRILLERAPKEDFQ